jgi:hypothetical protein
MEIEVKSYEVFWIYPVDHLYLLFSCSIQFPLVTQTLIQIIGMWEALGLFTCTWGSLMFRKFAWHSDEGNK